MDASRDIRRRLDRLAADPASIEGSWHPEVDALRGPSEGRVFAAVAIGPAIVTTIAGRIP